MNTFNRVQAKKPNSVLGRRPTDPEVVPYPGDIDNRENMQANNVVTTPRHKDYGKVPKYLEKYKEEAEELEQKRAELKAKQ